MTYKDPMIFLSNNEDEPVKVLFNDFNELEKKYKQLSEQCNNLKIDKNKLIDEIEAIEKENKELKYELSLAYCPVEKDK